MPLSIVLENYMKQPNKIFEVTHFSLEYIIYAKPNVWTARTGSSCFEVKSSLLEAPVLSFKTSATRDSEKSYSR